MRWSLLIGWGVAIYAIVFLMWSILVIHGLIDGAWPRVILVLTLAATLVVATRALRLKHWQDILPYSLGWMLIAGIFDFACAVPVSGWVIWSDWNIWVGYGMVVAIPLMVPQPPRRRRLS